METSARPAPRPPGRPRGLRTLLAILALALVAPIAGVAAAPAPRYGSELVFHGWSTDSRYIAYTRTRRRPPPRKGADTPPPDVQRMHRQVLRGAFAGFGSQVGGDVAGWARTHGYTAADPMPRDRVGPRETLFVLPGPRELTLELTVGDRVGWALREGDEPIAEHVFDAIYVDSDAELFVAPDRSQAVLVMHLSTGWVVDSAIYPVALERTEGTSAEPVADRRAPLEPPPTDRAPPREDR